jgi:hypothetical protein
MIDITPLSQKKPDPEQNLQPFRDIKEQKKGGWEALRRTMNADMIVRYLQVY